jgi:glycosyltransferase involved in cell wall biosynthesis
VLVFYGGYGLEQELRESGIAVEPLGKSGRWDVAGFVCRLYRALRRERPDVVHGYLGTPNKLIGVLKPFLRGARVVWGVRAANMDLTRYDRVARWSYRAEARLSPLADLIICNSRAGFEHAVSKGFPAEKMIVIPNGIDTLRFRPDAEARARVRGEWRVGEGEKLIGLVARLDPMKDHPTFLRAAAEYSRERPDVRFVCVGDGPPDYSHELRELAASSGLDGRLIWAGKRADTPAVYNALDVAVSSSYGEGFSNVIGEAMACGTPCVVTDVGDSAWIVGEAGVVVAPQNPRALAQAWRALPWGDLAQLGGRARRRVEENFSHALLVERTEAVLLGKARKKEVAA